jgi:DNA excision repair protein ERCC-2
MTAGKKSQVIICDYYHIFNEKVRKPFLVRTGKELEDSIIIIDEGHNLPQRLRQLLSWKLSQFSVNGAINEAKRFAPVLLNDIEGIDRALHNLTVDKEKEIDEKELVLEIDRQCHSAFLDIVDSFISMGEEIRISQKKSFIGAIGEFLRAWIDRKNNSSFIRTISTFRGRKRSYTSVYKKCLDPAIASGEVINSCHSCVMMSGTLLPLRMYANLLGFPKDTVHNQYSSPFPKENRLNVVIPTVTTRFTKRSDDEFGKFAQLISKFLRVVPGNTAVFFPSYELMSSVSSRISTDKDVLTERQGMTKAEKSELLYRLQVLSTSGAVLFGVVGGSFSEGVDYPDNMLQAVVIVGLPLEKPTLEVNALIKYYQKKFTRGWDYAYLYPAVNKALQAAGRCIRSSKDKGVVVFMDERYLWKNYRKCFPKDMPVIVSPDPQMLAKRFYSNT